MRADKFNNTAEVLKVVMKQPGLREREIAEKTGLGSGTVHRAMKELEKNGVKDQRLSDLVSVDLDIQELAQREMKRRLSEEPNEIPGADLKAFSDVSFKRSQLLSGKATDNSTITIKWET